jgi:hypothetical protein
MREHSIFAFCSPSEKKGWKAEPSANSIKCRRDSRMPVTRRLSSSQTMPSTLLLPLPFRGSELQLRHKPAARQRFRTAARIASYSRRRSRMPLLLPLTLTLPFGSDAPHLDGASDASQRLARESRASGKRLAATFMSELKLRPPKKRAAFLIDNFKKTRAIRNHAQPTQNNHHDHFLIDNFVYPLPRQLIRATTGNEGCGDGKIDVLVFSDGRLEQTVRGILIPRFVFTPQ